MTFPIDNITTAALDQTTDNPDVARAELYALALKVKEIIAATGLGANNALKLDANGNIPSGVGMADGVAITGTWKPEIQDGSNNSNLGQTYNVQFGRYTKIDTLVMILAEINMSSLGSLNTVWSPVIAGLPFICTPGYPRGHLNFIESGGLSLTNPGVIAGSFVGNSNYIDTHVAANSNSNFNLLSLAEIGINGVLRFGGFYYTV